MMLDKCSRSKVFIGVGPDLAECKGQATQREKEKAIDPFNRYSIRRQEVYPMKASRSVSFAVIVGLSATMWAGIYFVVTSL
jgi:hypothetical protein